jgi:hypothetical protein
MAIASKARRSVTRPTRSKDVRLALAIGERIYGVRLEWWTRDDCHVVYLDDLATGQTTRVVDLSNVSHRFKGDDNPASCSCRPNSETASCRHVRALRKASILPSPTRTEGE